MKTRAWLGKMTCELRNDLREFHGFHVGNPARTNEPETLCLVALLERVLFLRSLALEITATRSPSWSASVIFYNTWKAGRRSHASLLGQWIFWGDLKIYTRLPTAVMKRKSLLSGSETGLTLKWNHLLHQWRLESPGLRDYQSSSDPKKQDLKEQNSDRCLERWVVWNLIKSPHDPTCPNLFPPKPPPEKKNRRPGGTALEPSFI